MRNLPTDSLRSFLAVYDSGSVTTAADQIGRSQPAVSLQIKKLEEILETSLFRGGAIMCSRSPDHCNQ